MTRDQLANWQRNQACVTRDGCYHTERDSMSTFEVVISILVAIHTQSLRPHLNVRETLYLVNPFRIKFKVTLNIGVPKVGGKRIA